MLENRETSETPAVQPDSRSARDPVLPTVYVPYTLVANDAFDVVVRTEGDPLTFVRSIRERVQRRDADQIVSAGLKGSHLRRFQMSQTARCCP